MERGTDAGSVVAHGGVPTAEEYSSIQSLEEGYPKFGGKVSKKSNGAAPRPRPVKLAMHINSTQVENILNPVRGIRDAQRRRGIKPINHARQNIEAIKQMSNLNAVRKTDEKVPHKGSGKQQWRRPGVNGHQSHLPASRPPHPGGRNFVAQNIITAGTSKPVEEAKKDQDARKWLHKEGYGQVPTYLQLRKMELAAEHAAKQDAKRAAMLPPGMRLMDQAERVEALQVLRANRAEVESQLQELPLVIETPGQIKLRASLETRLREIEEAEKIFSRPKVLVKA